MEMMDGMTNMGTDAAGTGGGKPLGYLGSRCNIAIWRDHNSDAKFVRAAGRITSAASYFRGHVRCNAAAEPARAAPTIRKIADTPDAAATILTPIGMANWPTRLPSSRSEFAVPRAPGAVRSTTLVMLSVIEVPSENPMTMSAA